MYKVLGAGGLCMLKLLALNFAQKSLLRKLQITKYECWKDILQVWK